VASIAPDHFSSEPADEVRQSGPGIMGTMADQVVDSADVADSAVLGEDTRVWHLAQVRENAVLGRKCVVGRGAYVGSGVSVGDNCKIQNYALVYEPAELGHGVFVGPAAVFTNDHNPRAVNPDGSVKSATDWEPVGVHVGDGAAIGARAVCVAPVRIGRWAMVAAGSVVTKDVPDFALMAGVPARQIGWVGHAGQRLTSTGAGRWECPETHRTYREMTSGLVPDTEETP
jgi:UDP-2-acetamido-3-amino-2,3-dideoxy-glucuronate N-acetyltransferase